MRGLLVLCLLGASLHWAPLQCGSEPDPALRRYETPGEALYGLAQELKTKGNEDGWRQTLEYLLRRYPNSRFAVRAKQDLAGSRGAGASP